MKIHPPIYQTASGTPRDLGSLLSMKSQGFGEHVDYYQQHLGTNGHTGIDWPCSVGTPAYAAIAGKVNYVQTDFRVETGGGAGVIIQSPEGECLQWHLSRIDVKVSDVVQSGQQIGLTGDSGFSTGPHMHLEWRPHPLAYNNGWFGAVDPTPFMEWVPLPNLSHTMFDLVTVDGKEIWLVRNSKKTHVYNAGALLSIGDFSSIKKVTQAYLDAIPDSGLELATLVRE